MRRSRLEPTLAVVLWLLAPLAFAQPMDDALPASDPTRPAIGAWAGGVAWNDPVVPYAWTIYPGGTFTSGRLGRGQDGGGVWNANGARLTLKYQDGFRYEGELQQDTYSGNAYDANGRRFGAFSMQRVTTSPASSFEEP